MASNQKQHLRDALASLDLSTHAATLCTRLDVLLAADQQEQLKVLNECGVSKLGHRFRIAKLLASIPPPEPDDSGDDDDDYAVFCSHGKQPRLED